MTLPPLSTTEQNSQLFEVDLLGASEKVWMQFDGLMTVVGGSGGELGFFCWFFCFCFFGGFFLCFCFDFVLWFAIFLL